MDQLPVEIFPLIFDHLDFKSLGNFNCVCKYLNQIGSHYVDTRVEERMCKKYPPYWKVEFPGNLFQKMCKYYSSVIRNRRTFQGRIFERHFIHRDLNFRDMVKLHSRAAYQQYKLDSLVIGVLYAPEIDTLIMVLVKRIEYDRARVRNLLTVYDRFLLVKLEKVTENIIIWRDCQYDTGFYRKFKAIYEWVSSEQIKKSITRKHFTDRHLEAVIQINNFGKTTREKRRKGTTSWNRSLSRCYRLRWALQEYLQTPLNWAAQGIVFAEEIPIVSFGQLLYYIPESKLKEVNTKECKKLNCDLHVEKHNYFK